MKECGSVAGEPAASMYAATETGLARVVLEEMDVPVIVVRPNLRVEMCNRAGLQQLLQRELLTLHEGTVQVLADVGSTTALRQAIDEASRLGHQALVVMHGNGDRELSIGVVPVAGVPSLVLLLLGRSKVCPELSLASYSRAVGLTPAEEDVLRDLCDGASPDEIASIRGVKLSTVRTQIGSLRTKTGTSDLRDLTRKLAKLPSLPARIYRGLAC